MTLLAYAFYTTVLKIYGYRDDFLPPLKSQKEILNYKYVIEYKAAAQTKIKTLTRKYTQDKVWLIKKVYRLPIMWVFTYKEDVDGFIIRFKACLVVYRDL